MKRGSLKENSVMPFQEVDRDRGRGASGRLFISDHLHHGAQGRAIVTCVFVFISTSALHIMIAVYTVIEYFFAHVSRWLSPWLSNAYRHPSRSCAWG